MAVDYKRHGVEEILVEKCSRKLLQLELIVNCEICLPILHETRRVLIGKCGLTRDKCEWIYVHNPQTRKLTDVPKPSINEQSDWCTGVHWMSDFNVKK